MVVGMVHSLQQPERLEDVMEESDSEIPAPYLPATEKAYTLVLDLDETLMHYDESNHMSKN